ncbi:MAG: SOS response-associated peptidase [Gammaproteobacteria bacterium]|nr:SOS response-associated peptidase [Gammaproteobacteria bacterium]
MCGRYTSRFTDKHKLPASLGPIPGFEPRYNIAPQQQAPVLRMLDGNPSFGELRWGFQPSWLKDRNKAQINARAETLFSKPMFKRSALQRRCLVLASGWYEWRQEQRGKQPYLFHLEADPLFAFAGIWTSGQADDGDNYAIITTEANPQAAKIHKRMPVVLTESGCQEWLEEGRDARSLAVLLRPYPANDLCTYPVSTYVNSPRHTDQACIRPL